MQTNVNIAKDALDKIIGKARTHLYKPIQLAEILRHSRLGLSHVEPATLSTYRTASRHWRDEVSLRLVGSKSTSSARYQDDLFNANAMPPSLLAALDQENKQRSGIVENYIYHRLGERLQDVIDAHEYLAQSSPQSFQLQIFLDYFEKRSGLKRSVDKAYEIVVYALFSTLVEELRAEVTLTLKNPDPELLADFSLFSKYVLGVDQDHTTIIQPAKIYRAGVANAADRGLDMWANFGPAVQVKHLRLDATRADDMVEGIASDELVIVCKTAEANLIHSLLNQVGLPIRGIITQDNLIDWYNLCLTKYQERMGNRLLNHLNNEFMQEFPILGELPAFLDERSYRPEQLTGLWQL
jgi:hypothetical protein